MPKPTDLRILSVRTATERIAYRAPIKFGGRVVTDAVLLNVEVDVETRGGRRGTGRGSMPMGNAWAWPSKRLSGEQTLAAMLAYLASEDPERVPRERRVLPAGPGGQSGWPWCHRARRQPERCCVGQRQFARRIMVTATKESWKLSVKRALGSHRSTRTAARLSACSGSR